MKDEMKETEMLNKIYEALKKETDATPFLAGLGFSTLMIDSIKKSMSIDLKKYSQQIYQAIKLDLK